MNIKKETYFTIKRFHLQDKRIFPFHLYVLNPQTGVYHLFLSANFPMDHEKSDLLDFIVHRGGKIAINMRQKKTFLRSYNYYDLDIPSLVPADLKDYEKQRLKQINAIEDQERKKPFVFEDELKHCSKEDDFLPLILAAKERILTLSVDISHTVSLSRYFASVFMDVDHHLNRVVALSYFCAQSLGVTKEEDLGELVCAAFLAHIGETLLPPNMIQEPLVNMRDADKNEYLKHPLFSLHLIKKSQVDISSRCLRIIEQHHKRIKSAADHAEVDQLALILGACSHIFELNSGRITGTSINTSQILYSLKKQDFMSGLEFGFGDTIVAILTKHIEHKTAGHAA